MEKGLILTDVSLYWLTSTAGSSARSYCESVELWSQLPERSPVPTGVAVFPGDLTVRALAERDNTVIHWSEFGRGGHFAALEAPDLLVQDIRVFFRKLRPVAAGPEGGGRADEGSSSTAVTDGTTALGQSADAANSPSTQREEALATLYAEVLGVDEVGRDDGFFSLGGHSQLAIRLVVRIRSRLGVKVAVGDVFDCPSVAALAERLADAEASGPGLRPMPRGTAAGR
ncbi:phosphopantetheine-binding protein [Streptomyces decoyicus]|uniref:phosphopantetheine-binding protein n=1 Tax=Streptomyces decoyicus TaxID=249567 RepID=UPI0033A66BE0